MKMRASGDLPPGHNRGAPSANTTPPVIFSIGNREKLSFKLEARALPLRGALQHRVEFMRLHLDDQRLEQMLRGHALGGCVGFELLVEHPLVRRVHVDQDEPLGALGKNIDAMQLRKRGAERLHLGG